MRKNCEKKVSLSVKDRHTFELEEVKQELADRAGNVNL